jgi:hypothetical protein
MPGPCYRVRFLHEPPFEVRLKSERWRIVYEFYGKNGCKASLTARCGPRREIVILDGSERSVAHSLASVYTSPGTIVHDLWLRLAQRGVVELIEMERMKVERPRGAYIDCGQNVFVALGRRRARELTWEQVQRLCAEAAKRTRAR